MIFSRLPVDRFPLEKGPVRQFEYMGRERFREMWKIVENFRLVEGYSQFFLHGNMGGGKSHMLAALTCLLFRCGKRPVYIPDCKQMLLHPLPYIQSALLCAFAGASAAPYRAAIRSFRAIDNAFTFCGNLGATHLYFVIDQVNALEREAPNADTVSSKQKESLAEFLQKITVGHFSISSASASNMTMYRMAKKQDNEIKMSMMGGLSKMRDFALGAIFSCFKSVSFSQNEMKQWWIHHKDEVPSFQYKADQERVEDLTGCVPLLLQPFLAWNGREFREVEKDIWLHKDLRGVMTNVHDFGERMRVNSSGHNYLSSVHFSALLNFANIFA
jgi:hypothetical protein